MVEQWLTTGEAAKLLGFSASTVVRHIDAGNIAAYRLPGGHWRISNATVAELVRNGLATAGDEWPPGRADSRA
jgi:excisionase family DNA binding protein